MTWNDYYFLFLYSSCVKWPVKVCLSGKFGQKWPKIGQNMQKSSFFTFWPKLSNHRHLILIGNDFKRLIFFFNMSSSNCQSSAISATSTISAILAILYLRVSNIPFGLFFLIFYIVLGVNKWRKVAKPDFSAKPPFFHIWVLIRAQNSPKIRFLWLLRKILYYFCSEMT